MLNEDAESRALRLEAQKRQGISFVAIALIGFVYLTYRNPERLVRRPPPQRSKCSGSCTHRMPHALLARTHNLTRELRPSAFRCRRVCRVRSYRIQTARSRRAPAL